MITKTNILQNTIFQMIGTIVDYVDFDYRFARWNVEKFHELRNSFMPRRPDTLDRFSFYDHMKRITYELV